MTEHRRCEPMPPVDLEPHAEVVASAWSMSLRGVSA